jgi:hypothetical protein
METNELKNIWNTLAINNLIDKKLAEDNIHQIITKKGLGLISKMKKKIFIDYWVYLTALILVPIVTTIVHLNLMKPLPTIQAYFGIGFVEVYLIYMFINSLRKIRFLEYSNNSVTIKESLIDLQRSLKKSMLREWWLGLCFGTGLIVLTIIQFSITGGGFQFINFSKFTTLLSVFLILMLFVFPFLLKFEFKIKFSEITNDISNTIIELEKETE